MYVVYGKESCPFCVKAKELLHDEQVEHVYIDLKEHKADVEWLKSLGCDTVPQIFKMEEEGITLDGSHRIGGYDDLCEHFGHLMLS